MDFLSLSGSGGAFSSSVGQAIDKGSSEVLLGPDWALNMEICDQINMSLDNAMNAIKAFRMKLKSDNPKVIQLTLTMIETAVKNCNASFHSLVGARDFLPEVAALTDGKKGWEVREQALALIQDWGLAFQAKQDTMPYFYETYMKLRLKGIQFPPVESSAPIFTPPAQIHSNPSSARGTPSPAMSETSPAMGGSADDSAQTEAELNKLKTDLLEVSERTKLCREMLPISPGIKEDDTLAELIGFMEACRPRLVDVIEAGMQGALNEELLELALRVNDDLLRTLEAEKTGNPLPPMEDDQKLPGGGGATDDLLDFEDIKKEDATPLIDTSEVAVVDDALRNAGGGGGAQVSSGNPFDSFTGAIQPPPSSTSLTAPPQTATTTAASASLSLEGLKIDFREGQTRPTSTSDPLSIHDDFDKFLENIGSPPQTK